MVILNQDTISLFLPFSWPIEYILAFGLVVGTTIVVLVLLWIEYSYFNTDRFEIEIRPVNETSENVPVIEHADDHLKPLYELSDVIEESIKSESHNSITLPRSMYIKVERSIEEAPFSDRDDLGGKVYVRKNNKHFSVTIRELN